MSQDAQWEVLYKIAMLELNPARLQASIDIARSAMRRRFQELRTAGIQHTGNSAEMQAIADGLHNLHTVEQVECGTPSIHNNEDGSSIQEKAS